MYAESIPYYGGGGARESLLKRTRFICSLKYGRVEKGTPKEIYTRKTSSEYYYNNKIYIGIIVWFVIRKSV